MKKIQKFLFLGALLIIVGVSSFVWGENHQKGKSISSPLPSQESPEEFVVRKVIDGDTIVLENGEVVRYIGIDTPEITKNSDCYAVESSNKNKELVLGKKVRLEKDISERDRYQRLLRFVYIEDIFVNDSLVRQGFAKIYTYPPDIKYKDQFLASEKYARENNLGLWSKCNNTTPLRSGVVNPTPTSNGNGIVEPLNISCSSNTYNCGDFKAQAEAQNVFDYCMKAVGYDVHKLDRDGDGKVCETLP